MNLLRSFQPYPALQAELRRWILDPDFPCITEPTNFGHRPDFGECAHECRLFPPYCHGAPAELELLVPESYRNLLRVTNGFVLYCMSFFGWIHVQPTFQCHSLVSANRFWINEYKRLPEGVIHIGSRTYSWTENLGYFMTPRNQFYAFRKSGEKIAEWGSLDDLFRAELPIARELYEDTKKRLAVALRKRA